MKGMELSALYYDQVIRGLIHERFPEMEERIAAGLVGEGSECFGFDDALSEDHDYGVHLCLWMNRADYEATGAALAEEIGRAKESFEGVPVVLVEGRHGVLEQDAFFQKYLGKKEMPLTVYDWLFLPSHHLATASNGRVFHDAAGHFTGIWSELRRGYPEDIRLKKLAAQCMKMEQSGVYNYPRMMRRGDVTAAALCVHTFMKAVIRTVYLLNNRYAPFYKWMHRGMRELPVEGEACGRMLDELCGAENKSAWITRICARLVQAFAKQKISDADTLRIDLTAHAQSINGRIENEGVRKLDLFLDRL